MLTDTINNVPSNKNYMTHKGNQSLLVRDTKTNMWIYHLISHQMRSTYFYNNQTTLEMPTIDEREYDQTDTMVEDQYIRVNKQHIKSIHLVQDRFQTCNNISETNSLEEFIQSKKNWHHTLTRNNTKIFNASKLTSPTDNLTNSTDGGSKNGKGCFGVVFSENETILLKNYGRLPEIYNDIHSYRSEGMGILCSLTILKNINQYCEDNNT
jgi:hypothetical protein